MGITGFRKHFLNSLKSNYVTQNIINVDHIYFDVNSFCHEAFMKATSLDHAIKLLFVSLSAVLKGVHVNKSITIALDGPATRAKLLLQRQRRRKRSSNAKKKGIDTVMLTPGTSGINIISKALIYFAYQFVCRSGTASNVCITVSTAETPGEGEHKVMAAMCDNAYLYDQWMEGLPPITHALVGADSDLFVLSQAVDLPPGHVICVIDSSGKNKIVQQDVVTAFLCNSTKSLYPIAPPLGSPDELQLRRDFALVSVLGGDDYLPSVCPTSALQKLFSIYGLVRSLFSPHVGLLSYVHTPFRKQLSNVHVFINIPLLLLIIGVLNCNSISNWSNVWGKWLPLPVITTLAKLAAQNIPQTGKFILSNSAASTQINSEALNITVKTEIDKILSQLDASSSNDRIEKNLDDNSESDDDLLLINEIRGTDNDDTSESNTSPFEADFHASLSNYRTPSTTAACRNYLHGLLMVAQTYARGQCADYHFTLTKKQNSQIRPFALIANWAALMFVQEEHQLQRASNSYDLSLWKTCPLDEHGPAAPLTCALSMIPSRKCPKYLPRAVVSRFCSTSHPILGSVVELEECSTCEHYLNEFKIASDTYLKAKIKEQETGENLDFMNEIHDTLKKANHILSNHRAIHRDIDTIDFARLDEDVRYFAETFTGFDEDFPLEIRTSTLRPSNQGQCDYVIFKNPQGISKTISSPPPEPPTPSFSFLHPPYKNNLMQLDAFSRRELKILQLLGNSNATDVNAKHIAPPTLTTDMKFSDDLRSNLFKKRSATAACTTTTTTKPSVPCLTLNAKTAEIVDHSKVFISSDDKQLASDLITSNANDAVASPLQPLYSTGREYNSNRNKSKKLLAIIKKCHPELNTRPRIQQTDNNNNNNNESNVINNNNKSVKHPVNRIPETPPSSFSPFGDETTFTNSSPPVKILSKGFGFPPHSK